MLTPEEVKILDINSEYFGVSREELMENAGKAVVEAIKSCKPRLKDLKIIVFCGLGNNGGDGFVVARYLLKEGVDVRVFLAGDEERIKSLEARKNFERIKNKVKLIREFEDGDIIIDALLGVGIKGEVREPIKSLIEKINSSKAFKVSIDLPSGLRSDVPYSNQQTLVKANLTVTFHDLKKGMENLDNVVVKKIGIPKEAELYVGPGELIVNLKRRKDSHKGENGRVLIIGGSDLYYGAPILSGLAALRSGADLVYLLVPEINFEVTRNSSPDFIVRKYAGEYLNLNAVENARELARVCDVILIGPGLGSRKETLEAVERIFELEKTFVVDADAIKARPRKNAVYTPHAKEFELLTGEPFNFSDLSELNSENLEKLKKHAKRLNSTILLKGKVDIIASPEKTKLNITGNEGMSVGGTGDVLAGIVASFIAQGFSSFYACCSAAFLNGLAGDELLKKKSYGFTASDLIEQIPFTLRKILDLSLERPKLKERQST